MKNVRLEPELPVATIYLNFNPITIEVQSNSKSTNVKFKYTDIFHQNNSSYGSNAQKWNKPSALQKWNKPTYKSKDKKVGVLPIRIV